MAEHHIGAQKMEAPPSAAQPQKPGVSAAEVLPMLSFHLPATEQQGEPTALQNWTGARTRVPWLWRG